MRGNISKKMVEKMKKESLGSEPNGSQCALEINCEEIFKKNGSDLFW
jgi:hypothetical protein